MLYQQVGKLQATWLEPHVPKIQLMLPSPKQHLSLYLHVWARLFMFVALICQAMTLSPVSTFCFNWFIKHEEWSELCFKTNSNTPGPACPSSLFKQSSWKMVQCLFAFFDLDCFPFPEISRALFKNLLLSSSLEEHESCGGGRG